jgi:hypothetical protein
MSVSINRPANGGGVPQRAMYDREQSVAKLERRLEDGWQRIDEGKRGGADVAGWEDFWMVLLRQYEDEVLEMRSIKEDW